MFRNNPMLYLNEQESMLLDQAQLTASILYEVAELRQEVEGLRLEKLKRAKETQEQFDNNNAFIGNMLSVMIKETESKIL